MCEGRALDVGANDGAFLQVLESIGFSAVGLEPQEQLVKLANDNGFDVRCGSFPNDVPEELASAKFNLIAFNETIFYFPDLRKALLDTRRLLHPGGSVLIKAHLGTSAHYDEEGRSRLLRYGDNVQAIATPKAISYWMSNSGFKIVAKAAGHWPRGGAWGRFVNRLLGFAPTGMPLIGRDRVDVMMILARVSD